jgi:hypothetical protein
VKSAVSVLEVVHGIDEFEAVLSLANNVLDPRSHIVSAIGTASKHGVLPIGGDDSCEPSESRG